MVSASAYVESGSGSLLVSLLALAGLVLTVGVAVVAKQATDRRGRNGWVYFALVLLFLPLGLLAMAVALLTGRERTGAA